MSEGGEELQQENALAAIRARRTLSSQDALRVRTDGGARNSQDNAMYNETHCDEEYREMCHRLENHLEDLTACDVQVRKSFK